MTAAAKRRLPAAETRELLAFATSQNPATPRLLGIVAALSTAAGFGEGAALAIIVRTATGLAGGSARVGVPLLGDLTLRSALLIAAGFLVGVFGLQAGCARAQTRLVQVCTRSARSSLIRAYLSADWAEQRSFGLGQLQEHLTTSSLRTSNALDALGSASSAIVVLLALLVSCLLIAPVAVVAGLGIGCVAIGVLRPLRAGVRRAAARNAAASAVFAREVASLATVSRDVLVFGVGERVGEQVIGRAHEVDEATRRVRLLQRFNVLGYQYLMLLVVVAVLVGASSLPTSEVSRLGAAMLILLRAVSFSQAFLNGLQVIAEQTPFARALRTDTQRLQGAERPAGRERWPSGSPGIDIEGVTFAYPGSEPSLTEISLSIPPGEFVAVVGPSGAGKSTLVHLLARLEVPTEGRVSVGGTDAQVISSDEWTRHVALVPQAATPIVGSLEANVAFFRAIDPEAVEAALVAASLDQTTVAAQETRSTALAMSGGQLQRMSIARALAGSPSILILDEPTAALDVDRERAIESMLRSTHSDRTVVVVAHRGSTVAKADRLILMESGRIVDEGSVEAVASRQRFVRDMLQAEGSLDGRPA